jgi:hypothetical protein
MSRPNKAELIGRLILLSEEYRSKMDDLLRNQSKSQEFNPYLRRFSSFFTDRMSRVSNRVPNPLQAKDAVGGMETFINKATTELVHRVQIIEVAKEYMVELQEIMMDLAEKDSKWKKTKDWSFGEDF